ncbi:hypothetical protein ACFLVO_04045 [Chloroflexota bacterium]
MAWHQSPVFSLDMLGVTVWLDGQTVEVTGTIEPELQVSRCTHHPDVRPMVVRS